MQINQPIYTSDNIKITAIYEMDKVEISNRKWLKPEIKSRSYTIHNGIEELEIWVGHLFIENSKQEESWALNFEDIGILLYNISSLKNGEHVHLSSGFDVGTGGFDLTKVNDEQFDLVFIENKVIYLTINNLTFNHVFKLTDKFLRNMHTEFDKVVNSV